MIVVDNGCLSLIAKTLCHAEYTCICTTIYVPEMFSNDMHLMVGIVGGFIVTMLYGFFAPSSLT